MEGGSKAITRIQTKCSGDFKRLHFSLLGSQGAARSPVFWNHVLWAAGLVGLTMHVGFLHLSFFLLAAESPSWEPGPNGSLSWKRRTSNHVSVKALFWDSSWLRGFLLFMTAAPMRSVPAVYPLRNINPLLLQKYTSFSEPATRGIKRLCYIDRVFYIRGFQYPQGRLELFPSGYRSLTVQPLVFLTPGCGD